MINKIISTELLSFGNFLQDLIMPKLLRRFRQHHTIKPYIETAIIICYRWAAKLNPNLAEANYKLGLLLKKQQKWKESAIAFGKILKSDDFETVDVYKNLAKTLFKLERFEESIAVLNKGIEINPQKPIYYILLGDSLSEQNKINESITNYQIAVKNKVKITHSEIILNFQKVKKLSVPNYLIIGQPKCGTSFLYSSLTKHPQILPAIKKEINFWHQDANFQRGLDWYLAHFPPINKGESLITGEASTEYLDSSEAPQRIFQKFPNIKLIILLRNPVDRAISSYYMYLRKGVENCSIETAIFSELKTLTKKPNDKSNNLYHLPRCRYIYSISRWMKLFSQKQFLIVKSEDLFIDPVNNLNNVFKFLGVESHQLKEYKKKNTGDYPSVSKSMRQALNNYFQPFNKQLEEYLDRKFNWDS